eukprot:scaffold1727_cov133-Cylindrotheca_fusiformis.AAC.1
MVLPPRIDENTDQDDRFRIPALLRLQPNLPSDDPPLQMDLSMLIFPGRDIYWHEWRKARYVWQVWQWISNVIFQDCPCIGWYGLEMMEMNEQYRC